MITIRSNEYLKGMLRELLMLPNETEWIEFKHNNSDPETIGEYISALSNAAALIGKLSAFMVWGVEDKTHNVIGTSFKPFSQKKDQEDLENWLLRHLTPRINFSFYEIEIDEKNIVIGRRHSRTELTMNDLNRGDAEKEGRDLCF